MGSEVWSSECSEVRSSECSEVWSSVCSVELLLRLTDGSMPAVLE